MRGGEYVAKGSFGCVYKPAILCTNGNTYPDHIGKVYFKPTTSAYEKAVAELLSKIDPQQRTMIYPIDKNCLVTKKDISFEGAKKGCIMKDNVEYGRLKPELQQMVMRYGGQSLNTYLRTMPNKLTRVQALTMLSLVFRAVQKLVHANMVHQDIKHENIVVGDDGKARLIDFGLLKRHDITTKQFAFYHKENYLFTVEYWVSAPEYRIRSVDFMRMGHKLETKPFFENQKEQIRLLVELAAWKKDGVDVFDKHYEESCAKLAREFHLPDKSRWDKTTSPDHAYHLLRKMGVHAKADIYSLGIVLLQLLPYLVPVKNDDPEVVRRFNNMVYAMMRPDPRDRPTIDRVVHKVQKITGIMLGSPTTAIPNNPPKKVITPAPTPGKDDCPPGKVRNPKTGRCVNETSNALKQAAPVEDCPPGKVRNPKTGRCVNENSKALKQAAPAEDCPPGKVRNPKTGRCVDANGKIGKQLAAKK
jgi:serine/threonine protein kinase